MSARIKSAIRHFALVGALVMIVGLGATSAASAETNVPVWSTNGTPLPLNTAVPYSGSSVHGLSLQWTYEGTDYWIECTTLSASGDVVNYSGEAGVLNEGASLFKQCHVAEVGEEYSWTTCEIPLEIPIYLGVDGTNHLTNTPYPGGGLELRTLMYLNITNCSDPSEDGEWMFRGLVVGTEGHGAWPGEILFPEGGGTVRTHGVEAQMRFGLNIQEGTQEEETTPIKVMEAETNVPVWSTGGTPLPLYTAVPYSGSSVHGLSLKWTYEGTDYWIECTTLSANGDVENPTKAGTLKESSSLFKQCHVAEAGEEYSLTTCEVPLEIPLELMYARLQNTTTYPGGSLHIRMAMTVKVTNCSDASEDGEWSFTASPFGSEGHGEWPGEILFPEGTPIKVVSGGMGEIRFGLNIQEGEGNKTQEEDTTPIKVMEADVG